MNVLVVDDHAPFRARARRMLELAGHRVVGEAATPDEALEQSARLAPEVVLLDVQLGDADGLAILDALSRCSPAPRVVLLSSREAQDYGSRLDGIAAAGFIHKPDLSAGSFAAALVIGIPGRIYVITTAIWDSTLSYPPDYGRASAMGLAPWSFCTRACSDAAPCHTAPSPRAALARKASSLDRRRLGCEKSTPRSPTSSSKAASQGRSGSVGRRTKPPWASPRGT